MITLRTFGGLGNRLFAINSLINLCESIEKDLNIIWQKNHDLNAGYHELFTPLTSNKISITIEEHDKRKLIFSDRALSHLRQKLYNRFLKIYQYSRFDKVMHAIEVHDLKENGFSFESLSKHKNVYMTFWGKIDQEPINTERFKLLPEIESKIPVIDPKNIGIHVRRTDHANVIKSSPIENYFAVINNELQKDPSVLFFLASDSAQIKKAFKEEFGQCIQTLDDDETDRNSLSGIQNALCDLYSLAQTSRIYASSQSTFALLASEIHTVPFYDISSIEKP